MANNFEKGLRTNVNVNGELHLTKGQTEVLFQYLALQNERLEEVKQSFERVCANVEKHTRTLDTIFNTMT